ncbi:MAG TPA: SDR family oxidoreductase [Dehalococcoidia bacterium]|nr:SDR family oxidoreductase [Dehalococcoidia bacterium]
MRVLVTGNLGYIGPAMVSALLAAGHDVRGLDSGLFVEGRLEEGPAAPTLERDLRDVQPGDLAGIEAIVHLANLSNDPLGQLDPKLTHAVNVDATVRLARLAREAGVRRFLNSSSCSVYGAAEEDWVDETSEPRPVTDYGISKIRAEAQLAALANDAFCVASFRNATAFGYSPSLRTDLVVNDLVTGALLNGQIRLNSDGSAWRPLVHIGDIAQAFTLALAAPAARLNRAIVNVGADEQNYQIIDVARAIAELTPGARLSRAEGAGPDKRSYRVRFGRIRELLPGFACAFDLRRGVQDLVANLQRVGFRSADGCVRLAQLQRLRDAGNVDESLRFVAGVRPAPH